MRRKISSSLQPSKNGNGKQPKKKITNAKKKLFKSQIVTATKETPLSEINRKNDTPKKRNHPEYGTSKLEKKFASEFLDKLGVKYTYQFKAESIGRYYDFYLPEVNALIEVDGSYYHAYGLIYEEMSPMQKKNHRVDEQKNKWAAEHCIPLIRIWEHDINKNPKKVMDLLVERIGIWSEQYRKKLDKKKRH